MNRRDFLAHALTLAAGAALAGCGRAETPTTVPEKGTPMPTPPAAKPLILFYSWSGNTRALARLLAKAANADLFELMPEKPYPTVYHDCTEQAKKDIAAGLRPTLKALPDLTGRDTILIGSPNWWGTVAPPVSTMLEQPTLAGKKVALFITHGGGGLQRCEHDFRAQCKGTPFGQTLTVSGSRAARAETEALRWLKALNLAQ